MYVYADRLYSTLVDIIRIPSTSGHEEYVRSYLELDVWTKENQRVGKVARGSVMG
jgi:hypothetical protein